MRRLLFTLYLVTIALLAMGCERRAPAVALAPLTTLALGAGTPEASGAAAEGRADKQTRKLHATSKAAARAFVRDLLRTETRAQAMWEDDDGEDDDDDGDDLGAPSNGGADGPDDDEESFPQTIHAGPSVPRIAERTAPLASAFEGLGPSPGHARAAEPPPRS